MALNTSMCPRLRALYNEEAVLEALHDLQRTLAKGGLALNPTGSHDFRSFMEADQRRWADLVRTVGIKRQ